MKKIFNHDAWNVSCCFWLHQAKKNNTATHETEQTFQEKNWDSAHTMIEKNHQAQQDSDMLDHECDLISTNQHTHWQKAALSKWAQILQVLSWKLSSHAVL